MSEQTIALRERAVAVQSMICNALGEIEGGTPELVLMRAGMLNNLANRLSALGRREQALTAAEEAVSLRRTLVSQRPDAFRPDLATSLMVLANCVDELDRKPEGLAANAEAIATLALHFAGLPHTFAALMTYMVRGYAKTLRGTRLLPGHGIAGAGYPRVSTSESRQE